MAENRFKRIVLQDDYAVMIINNKKHGEIKVLIDIEDIDLVKMYSWHAIYDKTINNFYICHRFDNKTKGRGCIKLHRLLTSCPRELEVDHINHNTLDNRKKNLKVCTHFENQQNLRSKSSNNTGVYKRNRFGRQYWVANISKNCKRYTKDCKSEEEAIAWRKNKEKELYELEGVVINQ